jgi:prepilin-type N-terminal cleavage/methylation domain-containing protein
MSAKLAVRRAFTLAEVIVTVSLVALLAAITLPTMAGQLSKSGPAQVWGDFVAIRSAVDGFVADIRKYPKRIGQLTTVITSSTTDAYLLAGCDVAQPTLCTRYGTADIKRWTGPYLNKDGTNVLSTGYGLTFDDAFSAEGVATSGFPPSAGSQLYAIATIQNVDISQWQAIDNIYDDGNALTGSIRYSSATKVVKFLLQPIE